MLTGNSKFLHNLLLEVVLLLDFPHVMPLDVVVFEAKVGQCLKHRGNVALSNEGIALLGGS